MWGDTNIIGEGLRVIRLQDRSLGMTWTTQKAPLIQSSGPCHIAISRYIGFFFIWAWDWWLATAVSGDWDTWYLWNQKNIYTVQADQKSQIFTRNKKHDNHISTMIRKSNEFAWLCYETFAYLLWLICSGLSAVTSAVNIIKICNRKSFWQAEH